jgi:GTP cyclohydrolase I
MAIDKEAIKEHIRGILVALGDDPDREGLKETPDRVARMYEEVFEGMNYTNDEIAEMFNKSFERPGKDTSDMVLVKDIEVFSYCEHHMALMYDMHVSVAYIPKGKVLGLSKIARIADMVAKRSGGSKVANRQIRLRHGSRDRIEHRRWRQLRQRIVRHTRPFTRQLILLLNQR